MKTPTGPESDLNRAIDGYLTMIGVFHWRANSGAFAGEYKGRKRFVRFGLPGQPDWLGILPGGRGFGIEAKVGRGKQTFAQQRWQEHCEASGGLYILARSLNDVILGLGLGKI